MKLQIAHVVSGNKRGLTPRTPDTKFHVRSFFTGGQVLLRERSSFVDRVSVQRDPVEDRIRGKIHKLPEEILIEIDRRFLIPADRKLQTSIKGEPHRSEANDRVQATVEGRVVGITIENRRHAGIRNLAARIYLFEEAGDHRELTFICAEVGSLAALIGRAWRWQRSAGGCAKNLLVELVNGFVFEDGTEGR